MIDKPFIAALNHLLAAEPWARERLAPFAGEVVEFRFPPFPSLRIVVRQEGMAGSASDDAQPSLVVALKPEAPAAFLRGREHFLHAVEVSGNARLAEALMVLARNLRWDFEEDLSRVFGDIAAHRMAEAARAFGAWQKDAAGRLGEAFADYLTEESGLLARGHELEALTSATARLRDGLERLEQRMRRLG